MRTVKQLVVNDFLRRLFGVLSVDVLARASGIILIPIYLKLMPQYEYGVYGYVFSFVGALALVLNFGLYVSQMKLVSRRNGYELDEILFTINFLLFSAVLLVLVVLYVFELDIKLLNHMAKSSIDVLRYRAISALLIVGFIASVMQKSFFMATENIKLLQLSNIARLLLSNGVVICALYFSSKDQALVRLKYSGICEIAICMAFGAFLFKKFRWKFNRKIALNSLNIGIPVMMAAILNFLFTLSDRVVLERYIGFERLAVYNLSASIASVIPLLISSFQTIYAPLFFKDKNFSFQKTNKVILSLGVAFFIIACSIVLCTFFLIRWGIVTTSYKDIVWISPILLGAGIFQALTQIYSNYFILIEKTYINFLIVLFSTSINIIMNFALIPSFGISAAAWSSAISAFIALIVSNRVIRLRSEKALFNT